MIEEIQAAYYMVAATGVLVAAAYYVLNMRATLETRRIAVVENIMKLTNDVAGSRIRLELLNYEWSDYEDFERKYGSDNNVDAAAKRYAVWTSYNSVGAMLRKGMVEAEDLYDIGASSIIFQWPKWSPIVCEVRRRYMGEDFMRDFEYLFVEIMKVKAKRDPSYKIPETLSKYVPNM